MTGRNALSVTIKETYLTDVAIPIGSNLSNTITERLQKYRDLKEQYIRIRQPTAVYRAPLVLTITDIIPNKLNESLKLLISALLYIS